MTKVSCKIVEGLIPDEKIACIEGADGDLEEVSVPTSNISGDKIIASEILRHQDRVLIELPRESASRHWRIWVNESLIVNEAAARG